MKSVCAFALLLVLGSGPTSAGARPPVADHPILGSWSLTLADGQCTEIYHFRADGTSLVTSGEEVAESEFDIADRPSPKGFYRMVDTITKDNGRKDCIGEITRAGRQAISFAHFLPSGEAFILCQSETLDACFGPLRRLRDKES